MLYNHQKKLDWNADRLISYVDNKEIFRYYNTEKVLFLFIYFSHLYLGKRFKIIF
jgi:hypothetical protein